MLDTLKAFYNKYKMLVKWITAFILLLILILVVIFQYFFVNNINSHYNALEEEKLSFKNHINNTVLNHSLFLKGLNKNFNLITFDYEEEYIEFITNEIEFIEENTIYESVYYVDLTQGALITNNHFTSVDEMYRYFPNIEWYEDSIKYQRAEISDVMIDFDSVHRIIAMSIPIINGNQVTGFIVGKIKVKSLESNRMFNYNYKSDYIYTLTDSKNELIYKYVEENNNVPIKLLDSFFINNFSLNNENNYQHIYDGSTFSYWKFKINLNLSKIKYETINETNNLLIIFGIFFFLIFILLSKFFIKYKKEILLDINLNRKRQIHKILRRMRNDDFYLFFINIENLSILNEVYDFKFANNILVKFAADFNQFIFQFYQNKNNLIYLGGNDFVLILQLEDWTSARNCLDELLDRYSIKSFELQNKKVKLKMNYILYKFDRNRYDLAVLDEQMNKISRLMRIVFKKESMNFLVYTDYKLIQKIYEKHERVKEFLLEVIDNKAIEPFFQPIVDLKTKEIVQYEVLMRIVDQDIYLSPYPYIKISEKYGLIKKIDYLIIEKTLDNLKKLDWSPKISFNISSIELANRKHLINLINLIQKYDYKLMDITFEITETNIIEDFDLILENIIFLKSHNLKISLDDFGTGFSNLETLKKLKTTCDYIKIDGIFIKNLNETEEEQYIVKSIVNLAKAYQMEIVAEFIENEVIEEILKTLHVHYGQGYLFSKPKKIEEFYHLKSSN